MKAVDLRKMGLTASFEPETLFAPGQKVSAAIAFIVGKALVLGDVDVGSTFGCDPQRELLLGRVR